MDALGLGGERIGGGGVASLILIFSVVPMHVLRRDSFSDSFSRAGAGAEALLAFLAVVVGVRDADCGTGGGFGTKCVFGPKGRRHGASSPFYPGNADIVDGGLFTSNEADLFATRGGSLGGRSTVDVLLFLLLAVFCHFLCSYAVKPLDTKTSDCTVL
jgi:hypothetical protein